MQNLLYTSDVFRGSRYGEGHPLDMDRVWPSVELIKMMGWIDDKQIVKHGPAHIEELIKFHDIDYVHALKEAEEKQTLPEEMKIKFNIGIGNNPIFKEVFSRPATAAKASITAIESIAAKKANRILNISGGTHHGRKSQAYGFCFLNDCVLAILKAKELGFKKILYVDIDAHHCDGVQDVFSNDETVNIISIHEEKRWPFTGSIEDCKINNLLNFPVSEYFNEEDMNFLINDFIVPYSKVLKPDLLIIQAGADMLRGDPQSRISLSINAYWKAVYDLLSICEKSLILGGGGYNPYLTAKAWAGNWVIMNDKVNFLDMDINQKCREFLKSLKWNNNRVKNGIPEEWISSWRDKSKYNKISDEVISLVRNVKSMKSI